MIRSHVIRKFTPIRSQDSALTWRLDHVGHITNYDGTLTKVGGQWYRVRRLTPKEDFDLGTAVDGKPLVTSLTMAFIVIFGFRLNRKPQPVLILLDAFRMSALVSHLEQVDQPEPDEPGRDRIIRTPVSRYYRRIETEADHVGTDPLPRSMWSDNETQVQLVAGFDGVIYEITVRR